MKSAEREKSTARERKDDLYPSRQTTSVPRDTSATGAADFPEPTSSVSRRRNTVVYGEASPTHGLVTTWNQTRDFLSRYLFLVLDSPARIFVSLDLNIFSIGKNELDDHAFPRSAAVRRNQLFRITNNDDCVSRGKTLPRFNSIAKQPASGHQQLRMRLLFAEPASRHENTVITVSFSRFCRVHLDRQLVAFVRSPLPSLPSGPS